MTGTIGGKILRLRGTLSGREAVTILIDDAQNLEFAGEPATRPVEYPAPSIGSANRKERRAAAARARHDP